MKMDNNVNKNMNNQDNNIDNVIDFSEYINPENELSEEMLQAYLDASDMETPDMWERISDGYDVELEQIKQEKNHERKLKNKKLFGILVVAGMIATIVVPMIFVGMNRTRDLTDKSKNEEMVMDESFDEESDEYLDMESVVNESEMAAESAPMEDASANEMYADEEIAEEMPTESAPTDSVFDNYGYEELVDSAVIIGTSSFVYEDGCYVFCISEIVSIAENDYDLTPGSYVIVENTDDVHSILKELNIFEKNEEYVDYGKLYVMMYILDYYDEGDKNITYKVIVYDIELP